MYERSRMHLLICASKIGDLELIKKKVEVSAISDAAGPEKQ